LAKKYYQRAAKVIVGVVPSEELSEIEIFQKHLHEEIRNGLLALQGFGYKIPENALDKITGIASEWHKLWKDTIDSRIIEEKMTGDISAHSMAISFLALVETRKNAKLKRITDQLVSELTELRRQL
jgi:hypothetical protein